MIRMGRMSTDDPHDIFWDKRLTLRFHPETRKALRRVVHRLAVEKGMQFQGQEATQEAIVNATWLALLDMDPEKAAQWLAPYLRRVESLPPKPRGQAADAPGMDASGSHGEPEVEDVKPATRSKGGRKAAGR